MTCYVFRPLFFAPTCGAVSAADFDRAAEISESVYTIPNEPDAEGFYRLTDHVTRDNGKPDCSGNAMKPGAHATHFVRFHPSGTLFVLCAEASIEACIGPFTRVRGEEI